MPTADCRSHPPAPANITAPPRRCDRSSAPSMTRKPRREDHLAPKLFRDRHVYDGPDLRVPSSGESIIPRRRIIRRVGLAEDVDRIARLQVPSGERRVGVEREIKHRERTDAVEDPDRDPLHLVPALFERLL